MIHHNYVLTSFQALIGAWMLMIASGHIVQAQPTPPRLATFGNAVAVEPYAGQEIGDYRQSVSIVIPPAPRGTQPTVRLKHSKTTGPESSAGFGWELQATSVISRHSLTGGIPGLTVDELYRIDGQDMVGVGAAYEPSVFDGRRAWYKRSSNTWLVMKDGWKFYYGTPAGTSGRATKYLSDSHGFSFFNPLAALGTAVYVHPVLGYCDWGATERCNTAAWYLHKTIDPFGNEITYEYTVPATATDLAPTYWRSETGDHLLQKITYAQTYSAGGESATVEFEYGDRPEARSSSASGVLTLHTHRLEAVRSFADGNLYSDYELEYQDEGGLDCAGNTVPSVNPSLAPHRRRSTLRRFLRHSVSSTPALASQSIFCIETQDDEPVHLADDLAAVDLSSQISDAGYTFGDSRRIAMALNIDGNGRQDLVVLGFNTGSHTHQVFLATGDLTNPFQGPSTSGAGLVAQDWQDFLNATLSDDLVYAFTDYDSDGEVEILIEDFGTNTVVAYDYDATTSHPYNFVPTLLDITACDLALARLTDINGDGLVDAVILPGERDITFTSEPSFVCEATHATWIRNTGTATRLDSSQHTNLFHPLYQAPGSIYEDSAWTYQRNTDPDCASGILVPELLKDPSHGWPSAEEVIARATSLADLNGDGISDLAVSLYTDWETVVVTRGSKSFDQQRPRSECGFSQIYFGLGDGTFYPSNTGAGPARLAHTAVDFGLSGTSDTAESLVGLPFIPLDLDGDGQVELLTGNASHRTSIEDGGGVSLSGNYFIGIRRGFHYTKPDGYGQASPVWDVGTDIPTLSGLEYMGSGNSCSPQFQTLAWGDYDGDGDLDLVTLGYVLDEKEWEDGGTGPRPTVEGNTLNSLCTDGWCAVFRENSRTNVADRMLALHNQRGGRTELEWGWSATAPNTNPQLPFSLEVLQYVDGADGPVHMRYGDARLTSKSVSPFGAVEVFSSLGGSRIFVNHTHAPLVGQPLAMLRRDADGSFDWGKVFAYGDWGSGGIDVPLSTPSFVPRVRECEFQAQQGYGLGSSTENIVRQWVEECYAEPTRANHNPAARVWDLPQGLPSEIVLEYLELDTDPLGLGQDPHAGSSQNGQPPEGDTPPDQPDLPEQTSGDTPNTQTSQANEGAPEVVWTSLEDATLSIEALWPWSDSVGDPNAAEPDLDGRVSPWRGHWGSVFAPGEHAKGVVPVPYRQGFEPSEAESEFIPNAPVLGLDYTTPLVPGASYGLLLTDYQFWWGKQRLDFNYQDRDTGRADDNLTVAYQYHQSPSGHWFEMTDRTVFDAGGAQLVKNVFGNFAAFNIPQRFEHFGTSSDSMVTELSYHPTGQKHVVTRPDLSTQTYTYAWCGLRDDYEDPTGEVHANNFDALCRTSGYEVGGLDVTYQRDGYHRIWSKSREALNNVSRNPATVFERTFYSDNFDHSDPEDMSLTWPRTIVHRDQVLEVAYTDGFGRETKVEYCLFDPGAAAGPVGSARFHADCKPGERHTIELNLYDLSGRARTTLSNYRSLEASVAQSRLYDEAGRIILKREPDPRGDAPAWLDTTVSIGPGSRLTLEPDGFETLVETTTLETSSWNNGDFLFQIKNDEAGRQISSEDPTGAVTTMSYDSLHRWSRRTLGSTVNLIDASCLGSSCSTYPQTIVEEAVRRDAMGRLLEVRKPGNDVYEYTYDASGRLEVTYRNGTPTSHRSYTPGTPSNLTEHTVENLETGLISAALYDGLGRRVQSDLGGLATAYTYRRDGAQTQVVDPDGLTTSFRYDGWGRLTDTFLIGLGGPLWSYTYDGADRLIAKEDADGVVTATNYNYGGYPVEILKGQPTWDTSTGRYLDNADTIVGSKLTLDAAGQPVVENYMGAVQVNEYDVRRRLKRRLGGNASSPMTSHEFFYDAAGRVEREEFWPVESSTVAVEYDYNILGQVEEARGPLPGATVHYEYDPRGRLRRGIDEMGNTTFQDFDGYDRIKKTHFPDGTWTDRTYRFGVSFAGLSDLQAVDTFDAQDAYDGVVHTEYFDPLNRRLASELPDGTYTLNRWTGRQLHQVEFYDTAGIELRRLEYNYDPNTGRLLNIAGPADPSRFSGSRIGLYWQNFNHTDAGRLQQIQDAHQTVDLEYDSAGLIKREFFGDLQQTYYRDHTGHDFISRLELTPVTGGNTRTTEYGYDPLGRMTSVLHNNGSSAPIFRTFTDFNVYNQAKEEESRVGGAIELAYTWTFDATGRPVERQTFGPGSSFLGTTGWSWLANGARDELLTPSGTRQRWEWSVPGYRPLRVFDPVGGAVYARANAFNLRGQPTEVELPANGQTLRFGYDILGRLQNRELWSGSALSASYGAFFDTLGQLTHEGWINTASGAWNNSYEYDDAGRLRQETRGKTGEVLRYHRDIAGNLVTTEVDIGAGFATDTTLTYTGVRVDTVNGNSLGYNDWEEVTVDQAGTTFTRSADGRVQAIEDSVGNTQMFLRDAGGMPTASSTSSGLRINHWRLNPAASPLEETEAGRTLTRVQFMGMDVALLDSATSTPLSSIDTYSGSIADLGGDTIGEPTAFGRGHREPGTAPTRFAWGKMERLEPTMLSEALVARHRVYDPQTQRFLKPDYLGLEAGLNRYQYVGGNPVSFNDPMGLSAALRCGDPVSGGGGTIPLPNLFSTPLWLTEDPNVGIPLDDVHSYLMAKAEQTIGYSDIATWLSALQNMDFGARPSWAPDTCMTMCPPPGESFGADIPSLPDTDSDDGKPGPKPDPDKPSEPGGPTSENSDTPPEDSVPTGRTPNESQKNKKQHLKSLRQRIKRALRGGGSGSGVLQKLPTEPQSPDATFSVPSWNPGDPQTEPTPMLPPKGEMPSREDLLRDMVQRMLKNEKTISNKPSTSPRVWEPEEINRSPLNWFGLFDLEAKSHEKDDGTIVVEVKDSFGNVKGHVEFEPNGKKNIQICVGTGTTGCFNPTGDDDRAALDERIRAAQESARAAESLSTELILAAVDGIGSLPGKAGQAGQAGNGISKTTLVTKTTVAAASKAPKGRQLLLIERVFFGQKRIGHRFSKAGKFKGATITSVAQKLKAGILTADDVPIEVFRGPNGMLITVNNRSLAALSLAKMRPTKITIVNSTRNVLRRLRESPVLSNSPIPGTRTVVTGFRNQILGTVSIP